MKPFNVEIRIWNQKQGDGVAGSYIIRRIIYAQTLDEAVSICSKRGWDAVVVAPFLVE